ncbi:MAG TPA: hypothetical protein VJJ82_03775 [Candidatus Nanoarchaeia archaeon]|nr:hypothetical protein [Candidatus Nanoarchaeia archaeon]
MGDTRAINIILAGIIIAIVIAGFYLFLAKQTIEKQTDSIKGSAGKLQTDRMIFEWASQTTLLHGSPEAIAASFASWFTLRKFTVGQMYGANFQEGQPRCSLKEDIVTCDFALTKSKKVPTQPYEETVLVPEKNGIRTIILRGLVNYEQ